MTHDVPAFTRRLPDGREQAACGVFVTRREVAPIEKAPTCPGCARENER